MNRKLVNITLDEWFEEWFTRYKIPKIKETSINPMKTKYRSNFGRLIGDMKVSEIRNMDIQTDGSVGGYMVKKMIEQQEKQMAGK